MDSQAMVTAQAGRPDGGMDLTVRRLGWVSIGLGATALLAPRLLGWSVGLGDRPRTMTTFGLREIGTGIGILAADDATPWMWARAGGDAVDIAALGTATVSGSKGRVRAVLALGLVAGLTVVDVFCAQWLTSLQARRATPAPDDSNRSGFPRPIAGMRGAAAEARATPAARSA